MDPGIIASGGPVQLSENSSDNVFLDLNLFYSFKEGVQWLFQRKLLFSKVFRGGPTFSRGSNFSGGGGGGGVQILFSIETHITCDFPGGTDPLSPLWIRTCDFTTYFSYFKRTH